MVNNLYARVNDPTGSEVVKIATKNGKTVCIVLFPKQEKIINDLAMEILKKTGTFSKSEAARQLIDAGAKALATGKS